MIRFTLLLLLGTIIIVWAQQAKVRDSDFPYAINDLRLKPDFCAGLLSLLLHAMYIIQLMYLLGFRITYPANHGEKVDMG